jgi:N utilization substance protein A
MTKEILLVAEAVSNEKGVSEDIIFEAIESGARHGYQEALRRGGGYRGHDRSQTGDYETVRRWLVCPTTELAALGTQFTTEEADRERSVTQAG